MMVNTSGRSKLLQAAVLGLSSICALISMPSRASEDAADGSGGSTEQTDTSEESASQEKKKPVSLKTAAEGISDKKKPSPWTFQIRTGLGAGTVAGEKNFKSDRLNTGVFAARYFPELEIPLPLLNALEFSAGAAYDTFSGVDATADRAWVVQNFGALLRTTIPSFPLPKFDLAVQAGASLQRMVAQEPVQLRETAKYGFGINAGGYLRKKALEGVELLAGAETTLGTASSLAAVVGAECNF